MSSNLPTSTIQPTQNFLDDSRTDIKRTENDTRRCRTRRVEKSRLTPLPRTKNFPAAVDMDDVEQYRSPLHTKRVPVIPKIATQIAITRKPKLSNCSNKMPETKETNSNGNWLLDIASRTPLPADARRPGEIPPDQESEPESDSDDLDVIYTSEVESDEGADERLTEWDCINDLEVFEDAAEVESDIEESTIEVYHRKPPTRKVNREDQPGPQPGYWGQAREMFSMVGEATKYMW